MARFTFLFGLSLLGLASSASAQDQTALPASPSATETLRTLAREAREAGRLDAAIEILEQAYEAHPEPILLVDLGQTEELRQRVLRAVRAYRRFLDTAPADAPERSDVRTKVELLEGLLVEVLFETNVPAHVVVDGDELAMAPGVVRLPSGHHAVELRAEGRETERSDIELEAGQRARFVVRLRRPGEPATPAVATPTAPTVYDGLPPDAFFLTLGLDVLSIAATVSFGVLALDLANRFAASARPSLSDADSGTTLAIAADVALGISLALTAACVIEALYTDWDGPRLAATPTAEGAWLGVQSTF